MDSEDNTLVLFAGQFDWDLIHNHLYYQGFVDSTYRDVELWKHPDQDVVFGLLPDKRSSILLCSDTREGMMSLLLFISRYFGTNYENFFAINRVR